MKKRIFNINLAKTNLKHRLKELYGIKHDLKIVVTEQQIMELMEMGYENKQIAMYLDLSVNTIASYRQELHAKLGSKNSIETLLFAKHLEII